MVWAGTQDLLALLLQEEYRTARQLADRLGVSEKTVRLRVQELNSQLEEHGAHIGSKARFGYRLEIADRKLFEAYQAAGEEGNRIPDSGKERSEYLLAYLLFHPGYCKAEDLCQFMYLSRPTLTNCLKMVEAILKRYCLSIERRPNYGMRILGEEFDIRRLIGDYFIRRHCLEGVDISHQEQEIYKLADEVRKLMVKYEVHLSELSFENFVNYVYVAWKRMKSGYFLKAEHENLPEIGIKEQSFIRELIDTMEVREGTRATEDEQSYLLLYLAGKRMIGNVVENDSNFIIHENTDRLAMDMLKVAGQEYHRDFYNNFEMRMTLNQHLVPFDVRMRYQIPIKNPMLAQIKEEYSLAYQMAHISSRVLREHYEREIPEDEIGYFALIFALALEKEQEGKKYDILVVCSTGKGTSRLLKYKYEQEFADYLRNIYVCDLLGLETFDTTKVDYIFTTVPINKEVAAPIVEVGVFLGTEDIQKVTDILRFGYNDGICRRYYGPNRFLERVPVGSKEEILRYICDIIMEREKVDDDFYELVLEREAFAQMDYGNMITLPHPNRIASEESFAYVAVLERPVTWNNLPVQVVLLTSIGRKEDPDRQRFYETTARFALSEESVSRLIHTPEYRVLAELLQK